MDGKATLDGWATSDSSARALARDIAGIAGDVATIAELQLRLFAFDLRAVRAGLVRGAAVCIAALVLLLACLPVALAACGLWLADVTRLTAAGGLMVAALGALVVVAGLIAFGRRQFKAQQTAFETSRKELSENLAAIKHVLSDYAGRASQEE